MWCSHCSGNAENCLYKMMADLFPTDPKRIRERIRRYERALKREREEGYGGDG